MTDLFSVQASGPGFTVTVIEEAMLHAGLQDL